VRVPGRASIAGRRTCRHVRGSTRRRATSSSQIRCSEDGPTAAAAPPPRARRGASRTGDGFPGLTLGLGPGLAAESAALCSASSWCKPRGVASWPSSISPSAARWNRLSSSSAAAVAAAAAPGGAAGAGCCSQGTATIPSSCAADQRCTARECFSPTATAAVRFKPSTLQMAKEGGGETSVELCLGGSRVMLGLGPCCRG
jgi:hypothetical protein